MNYGLLRLGDQALAVPVSSVREVLQDPVVSPVPLAPDLLAGMVLFRGEVLPVFEIGRLFQSVAPSGPRARVVVVQHNGVFAGLAADQASIFAGSPVQAASARFLLPQALETPAGPASLVNIPALFQELESSLSPTPTP